MILTISSKGFVSISSIISDFWKFYIFFWDTASAYEISTFTCKLTLVLKVVVINFTNVWHPHLHIFRWYMRFKLAFQYYYSWITLSLFLLTLKGAGGGTLCPTVRRSPAISHRSHLEVSKLLTFPKIMLTQR